MANPKSPPKRPREVAPSKDEGQASTPVRRRPAMPYDNLPEESFDRVARLVAGALHAPIAIVSMLDTDRHVVKSSVGLTGRSRVWRKVPLALGFSRQAATSGRTVVVSEVGGATADKNAVASLAEKSPDGVAYAVAPLMSGDGMVVGTLCAVDPTPRAWSEDEVGCLNDLAESLVTEME